MNEVLSIKSTCLVPCATAFQANMMRTAFFAMMPAEITWERLRDAIFWCNAHFRATGVGEWPIQEALSGKSTPAQNDEVHKQAASFAELPRTEIEKIRWQVGVLTVEDAANRDPKMMASISALYTSVILESWLFFEALVADLWTAAVDNGGKLITGRVASVPRKKAEEGFPRVEEIESNFKTHPGSFWREAGMVSFQKRRDIEDNYSIAFGPEIKTVFQSVAGGDIWALNAFRNCITHSAGKVDPGFKRQAAQFQEFRDFALKTSLPINGEIAARLRNASMMTGVALLQKVDAMLEAGD